MSHRTALIVLLGAILLHCAILTPAAGLADHITAEAFLITKAELRRHMAAAEDDAFRPATHQELSDATGPAQPNYMVVRFRTRRPAHYSGEAELRVNGAIHGYRLNVGLHYNPGWVEYFIPMDSVLYGPPFKAGSPTVAVVWNKLETK